MAKLVPRFKIWLENENGEYIIGAGAARILEAIEETNSLKEASKKLGISYKHAWSLIKRAEKAYEIRIVDTRRGGVEKGRTYITSEGRRLLRIFNELQKAVEETVEKKMEELV
ncbi:hypothetical protein DRO02_00940 [archaeon]|nr:MAG: hypothetical protein DRO02_00940 [archaeon]RLG66185.1 MAG: hypothetical protein DRO21_00035 [archaeon]